MSVPVPLDELAAALTRRSNAAYLLTVGAGRTHCVAARVEWLDGELVVPAGATSIRNAAACGSVVLLSPPAGGLLARERPSAGGAGDAATEATLDDYSLIVDADVTGVLDAGATGTGAGGSVRVRPTHAVFHRPVVANGGGHDCVHVYEETAPTG